MRTLSLLLLAAAACSRASTPTAAPATSQAVSTTQAVQPTAGRIPATSSSAEAPALFLEAERLYYEIGAVAATPKIEAVLAADPSYGRALLRMMQFRSGSDRAATIAKVRAGFPKLPALERRWLEARIALFGGGADESNRELFALAEEAPADWEVQMAAAQVAQFHYGRPAEARRYLTRALEAQPNWPAPYNMLAYTYSDEGDFERAIGAITRFSELSPHSPNALDSKGEILLQAGRLEEAEAAFRAALTLDPSFISFDGLAVTQLHRGELAASLAGLERGWKGLPAQAPERWPLGVSLQWVYLINERYDEAMALVPALEQVALDTGHQYPQPLGQFLRARVALHRERWQDALGHLELARAALERGSDTSAAFLRRLLDAQRVRALLGKKDRARAEEVLAGMMATSADDPMTRLAALLVAHAKGDLAAAKATGKSLFADRDYGAEAKLLIAELLASAGHADKARMLREEVTRTYHRNPRSYILRQRAERALKQG